MRVEGNQMSNWIPQIEMPKLHLPNMNTVVRLAPLAIAVIAAANAPRADGGPITEIVCMGICTAAAAATPAGALWWATCMEFCALTGFAPTP